jgi:hypothetical protein
MGGEQDFRGRKPPLRYLAIAFSSSFSFQLWSGLFPLATHPPAPCPRPPHADPIPQTITKW